MWTEHSTWNLNSLMCSLPQSQHSRVNSVPDTSKTISNTHRQFSSNSGVPTHPSNRFLGGTGLLRLYNLSCGEWRAQLRAEFGKTF